MSASIISNNLYRFIQDIEELYTEYSKKNPNSTYQSFYDYLDQSTEQVDEEKETMKQYLTFQLMNLCFKIDQITDNEIDISNNRLDSLDRIKTAFIIIFVVITIIFISICVLIGKAYKDDFYKASKMILSFVIIYLIVTTLFVMFLMFVGNQKRNVETSAKEVIRGIGKFKSFMHNTVQKVSNGDNFIDGMVAYRNQRKKNKNAIKLRVDDVKFVSAVWTQYVSIVIKNVHSEGNGLRNLKVVELTSNNAKILKGVNDILSPYYDLMLKSRQNFADASTKEGVMKILDATVIKELSQVDLFSLDDNTVLRDKVLIEKMEDGEHYKMLMRGFVHLMTYLYPVYKNVSYQQIVQIQKEEEEAKQQDKPNKQMNKSNISEESRKKVNVAMLEDPILTEIRQYYPLEKDNFKDEAKIMKAYDQSDNTKNRVEIVRDFVSDTVLAFNTINEMDNEKYIKMMNNTPSSSETHILMTTFAKSFHAYYENLYKKLITQELSKLDPRSTQYFVFNPVFMKDKINTYIAGSPLLSRLDDNYKKMMVNIIVDDIISEQKNRFIASYFSYEKDATKSLKVHIINSRMIELVQKVSPSLLPYDFKVSDYAKYILNKLSQNTDNISTNVTSAIETLLSNIDYEVGIQKGLVSTSLSDAANEMRYVPVHDFIFNLDQYKFKTLVNALKPDFLKQIVSAINPDSSSIFAAREFKLKMAKSVMYMLIIILVMSYSLYAITLTEKMSKNKDVFSDTTDDKGKLNAILEGDAVWGSVFKFGVPLAGAFMFISIYNSYVSKGKTNINFNKELMRENTEEIQQSVDELTKIIDSLDSVLTIDQSIQSIGNIKEIDIDTKQRLYKTIKSILITYDKCNYIVGIDKYDIPFPYAEVLTDGVMSVLILGLIAFTLQKFAPIARVVELKDLYEYKESSQTLVNDQTFITEIMTKAACHKDEVDGVMYTAKAIATMSILVFMVLYSLRIITATSEYRGGLYTSSLYENKKCAS